MSGRISVIAIVVMVSFMGSITAMLFFAGSNFPERTAPVPLDDFYDTSFWNLTDAYSSPLDVVNHSTRSIDVDYQNTSVSVNDWYFDYASETFRNSTVRINSVIITRIDLVTPAPAILYLHGYGEQYADFMQMLREFAAAGFVAMGIDQPGSGNSTGFPILSPYTFLNVTNGPQDASLYHSVWAAARAITLLESLPQVRSDALVVAGNSMGGLATFILSGIDTRVDGSIPMISAGNLLNSIMSGSLLNTVIVPSYRIESEMMAKVVKWFDPLAYTRYITKPVFMMFGTNDQFFPITSMIDTVQSIKSELTLNIVPNWGHSVSLEWSTNIIRWIDLHFRSGEPLPESRIDYYSELNLQGNTVKIRAETQNTDSVFLCWRSSEPGAIWFHTELKAEIGSATNIYAGEIIPIDTGKILFFVITIQEDLVQTSSDIYEGSAGSSFFPILLVISSIGILFLLHFQIWQPRKVHIVREVPYIIGILALSAGFLQPFITISGRAGLSIFAFIELYGMSFLLAGWFLPAVLTGVCFVIALSAFRHRFQFRAAVLVWLPVLFVVIVLSIIFSGIFVYFGDLFSIETGTGAIALIGSIPLMQILDKIVKVRANKLWYECV
ncbi:MAG: acetylxylan esterase [Candidatus Thorarchaeota archaeon]|nr:acetylxylan esterase [Candidatus Thorarchaeota archaeon]